MRKVAVALLTTVAMAAAMGAASAADLPARMPMKAQPFAPAFSWTGFYVGANAGYGWGDTTGTLAVPPGNFGIDGGLAGGQIGANYQTGMWVFGIEADYQWASIEGDSASLAGFVGNTEVKRFGTVRGRVGIAWDRWMAYGTGGYAFGARTSASVTGPGGTISDSRTLDGWTAGAGVEYAFAPNWSAKLEYLHVALDDKSFFPAVCAPGFCQAGADIDLIRVGLNYRFGGAGWR